MYNICFKMRRKSYTVCAGMCNILTVECAKVHSMTYGVLVDEANCRWEEIGFMA